MWALSLQPFLVILWDSMLNFSLPLEDGFENGDTYLSYFIGWATLTEKIPWRFVPAGCRNQSMCVLCVHVQTLYTHDNSRVLLCFWVDPVKIPCILNIQLIKVENKIILHKRKLPPHIHSVCCSFTCYCMTGVLFCAGRNFLVFEAPGGTEVLRFKASLLNSPRADTFSHFILCCC